MRTYSTRLTVIRVLLGFSMVLPIAGFTVQPMLGKWPLIGYSVSTVWLLASLTIVVATYTSYKRLASAVAVGAASVYTLGSGFLALEMLFCVALGFLGGLAPDAKVSDADWLALKSGALLMFVALFALGINATLIFFAAWETSNEPPRNWKTIACIAFLVFSFATVVTSAYDVASYLTPAEKAFRARQKLVEGQEGAPAYFQHVYGCLFRKAEQKEGGLIFPGTLAEFKSTGCLDWWTAFKLRDQQQGGRLALGWEKYGSVFQYRPIRDPQPKKRQPSPWKGILFWCRVLKATASTVTNRVWCSPSPIVARYILTSTRPSRLFFLPQWRLV
jgi:hypothetical protein